MRHRPPVATHRQTVDVFLATTNVATRRQTVDVFLATTTAWQPMAILEPSDRTQRGVGLLPQRGVGPLPQRGLM